MCSLGDHGRDHRFPAAQRRDQAISRSSVCTAELAFSASDQVPWGGHLGLDARDSLDPVD